MKRFSFLPLASIFLLAYASFANAQDYQKVADATAWKFSQEQANVTDSLLRFSKDYQVELVRPKNRFSDITIRIVDEGILQEATLKGWLLSNAEAQ